MRTTIDLPDALFREVKSTAAARGLKLKEFIAESLRAALDQERSLTSGGLTAVEQHRFKVEQHIAAMKKDRTQTGPVGPFSREQLHQRRV